MRLIKWLVLLFVIIFNSCSKVEENGNLLQIKLFTNYQNTTDTLVQDISSEGAYVHGLTIPSRASGDLTPKYFNFTVDFTSPKEGRSKFYYKLYYQNYSYKFKEHIDEDKGKYNLKAAENFYGSWESSEDEFKFLGELEKGDHIKILDSIRIIGNPRNEERYYSYASRRNIGDEVIDSIKREILGTTDWVKAIKEKSSNNTLSFDEQLHLDALWTIENGADQNQSKYSLNKDSLLEVYIQSARQDPAWSAAIEEKAKNNGVDPNEQYRLDALFVLNQNHPNISKKKRNIRARRNPRMGYYQFKLVVVSEEELAKLPVAVRNITQKDELHKDYLNPFFYFNNHNYIADNINSFMIDSKQVVKAKIRMSGENGIYVDPLKLRSPANSREYYTELASSSDRMFENAEFEQYFHVINKEYQLKNVPLLIDVVGDNYTQLEFKKNKLKYPVDSRKVSHTTITDAPIRTVHFNKEQNAIEIFNPGNESLEKARKENVGVATRIGLSYGKFTAKIKFPKILSDSNVWNGLTCAFWLFSDAMSDWNQRDICKTEGYLAKGAKKYSTDRSPFTSYSEIDIEIVKTSKHWPETSYGGVEDYPIDTPQKNRNLMITTTNWDLACKDPKNFHQGLQPIQYAGKTFEPHRWDFWYQAATTKFEYPHDKTVGTDLFYQIEWKPNEIIWRIGPSKDELEVIGYINDEITKIPNNQMISIVTQEFHYSLWWPLAPFEQNNVPYPKEDIKGYVYYVEVE